VQYVGNKVYENNQLDKILLPNGYIQNNIYYFYLRDHVGNNSVVARGTDGAIMQGLQYYPYGRVNEDESTGVSFQPYKYGGKEDEPMHGLGLYDSGARSLNHKGVPYTLTPDPLCEKYYSWSPYSWCAGNPIRNVDPTGMDWYIFDEDEDGQYQEKLTMKGTHRMAMKSTDKNGTVTYTLSDFNDPDADAKAIDNGDITQFETLSDSKVESMIDASGVRSAAAQNSPWSYAKNEATEKMDYGHYNNLAKNTFYIRENTAYNVGDIGNYLWGRGMAELGFDLGTARLGAYANNALFGRRQWAEKYNFGKGTYGDAGFWDSPGDQRAIVNGYSNSPAGKNYVKRQRAKWNRPLYKTSFFIVY
jgi:RHS repeat-associated protein